MRAVLIRSLKGALYGFVPLLAFYVAQQIGGVVWAVIVGGILSVAVIPLERRATGSMRWSWVGLVGVAFGGGLALATQNPKLFFLRSVVGDAAFGLAMIGSLLIGKPLVATFASWSVTISEDYKATKAYRWSFGVLTAVWGVVNLARAGGRGYMLATGSLGQLMVVNLATGWPVFALLVAFSVWYPRRLALRHLAETGGDPSDIEAMLLGGVEETFDVELALGAEE
jgi:intracellular septation protein A